MRISQGLRKEGEQDVFCQLPARFIVVHCKFFGCPAAQKWRCSTDLERFPVRQKRQGVRHPPHSDSRCPAAPIGGPPRTRRTASCLSSNMSRARIVLDMTCPPKLIKSTQLWETLFVGKVKPSRRAKGEPMTAQINPVSSAPGGRQSLPPAFPARQCPC